MPRMCSWDAPLGQTRREAAAGAAIICSKLSFRPATRARRPSTPRARGGARDPSPAFVPTCADGAFDGAHKRTRTARYGWSRVRLCTHHKAACAETDARPPESASMCPTLHTPERPVCRNGQERRDMAGYVSDFAHAWTSRVHKRTRPAPTRRAGVRLRTRPLWSRANADVEAPGPASARPERHTPAGRAQGRTRPAFAVRRHVRMCTPRLQSRACAHASAAAPHSGAASWPAGDGSAPCPPSGALHK